MELSGEERIKALSEEIENCKSIVNKKEKCYTYFYNADIDKDFNEKAVFISDGDWKNYMLNINKDSAK